MEPDSGGRRICYPPTHRTVFGGVVARQAPCTHGRLWPHHVLSGGSGRRMARWCTPCCGSGDPRRPWSGTGMTRCRGWRNSWTPLRLKPGRRASGCACRLTARGRPASDTAVGCSQRPASLAALVQPPIHGTSRPDGGARGTGGGAMPRTMTAPHPGDRADGRRDPGPRDATLCSTPKRVPRDHGLAAAALSSARCPARMPSML